MNPNITKLVEDCKKRIENEVISVLGPTGSVSPGKTIGMTTYDSVCDDFYTSPYTVKRIFVKDGAVLVKMSDHDGDEEENYLHDFGLGDIEQIVSLL